MAVGAVIVASGSFRLRDIAGAQIGPAATALTTGAWPWYLPRNAVRSPQLLVLFLGFFVTVLVEPARARTLDGDDGSGLSSGALRRSAFFFFERG